MDPSAAWKSSLSSIDRYEIIQRILSSLPSQDMQEAIAIEQTAFTTSASRKEYDIACEAPPPSTAATDTTSPALANNNNENNNNNNNNDDDDDDDDDDDADAVPQITLTASPDTGIPIGPYENCSPIASGVTSTVFRSASHALKLITTSRPIEPHNPQRETAVLRAIHPHPACIPLLDVFRDPQEHRPVLVFPYMPVTLAALLDSPSSPSSSCLSIAPIFNNILAALAHIHALGIIHRDVKPSAVLLASPSGPAYLSDFGTAYHPSLSPPTEPPASKVLDIGTGPYRAPEVLFGDTAYGAPVDMWACGAMLAEAATSPPAPLFESRPVHEDGNQLGLILSIFKTIGTPTRETWPEAAAFKVRPFELWTVFPPRPWDEILPGVYPAFRDAVARLVRYDGKRATAAEALAWECFANHVGRRSRVS